MVKRSCNNLPVAAVLSANSTKLGHGASGFTKSGVTGDTPPQSLIPAAINCCKTPGLKLGGA